MTSPPHFIRWSYCSVRKVYGLRLEPRYSKFRTVESRREGEICFSLTHCLTSNLRKEGLPNVQKGYCKCEEGESSCCEDQHQPSATPGFQRGTLEDAMHFFHDSMHVRMFSHA